MVHMSASVEVDEGLQCNGSSNVSLGRSGLDLLARSVKAVNVGLVMVLVMKLHDLTGDRGFERTVIICNQS